MSISARSRLPEYPTSEPEYPTSRQEYRSQQRITASGYPSEQRERVNRF